MATLICTVCDYLYNESMEDTQWEKLPEDWVCPICESPKSFYKPKAKQDSIIITPETVLESLPEAQEQAAKTSDDLEEHMSDIHRIAESGRTIIEPMRTKKPTYSWDDILIKGAQLAKIPLNKDDTVSTTTVIGKNAKQPMELASPIYITHMSFGALSREAKIALAQGSAAAQTAMCSGEGGILPDELASACKYIFEYVPNKYSYTEEILQKVDAIEIKIGQSAKPGMGGHLPGMKVTPEIAEIRGVTEGEDVISPSHFDDILTRNDLKNTINQLRQVSGGKPIGIKIAAGNIEDDLEIALYAGPDFVTIDGRAGATGAASKFVKAATSVPTIFALHRARKYLDKHDTRDTSLMITGGMRISPDFTKALAMGADAVAIGTAALIAIGCRQYRICNTGKCPKGITTQDPNLRSRFIIDEASTGLGNFLRVSTGEIADFARLTGNDDVHNLSVDDLCTTNSEISNHTSISHV